MNLQAQMEQDIKTAMKEKNAQTRDILRVLKGELERKGKESTNVEVSNASKKLIEGILESNTDNGEVAVLSNYILQQLDENKVREIVEGLRISENLTIKDMGKVMSHFKTNFEGQYDGKQLSTIVKETLV